MLVADGDTSGAFPHVWQETVNLSSGITYAFMGFAASPGQVGGSGIDASPAVLRFFVDGVQIPESNFGLNFTLPNPVGQWKEFFAFFTPVQSGSYTFSIADINTVLV